jgi:glyoxylase-like metal-dependent hydrolase (beta-lactamase superfamily II)
MPGLKALARGVWQLVGFPANALNMYLVEDVLIDAGTRWDRWRVRRQLAGRPLSMVALTHVHPDHQGVAAYVCSKYGIPLACHEGDVPAMEGRAPAVPDSRLVRAGMRFLAGPPHRVERVLRDGDEVAGFRVIHAPGHTPGHVIYFRESDRVALAGDVLANMHFLTGRPGLLSPPPFFCADARQNRESIRLLASLRPSLVCFGHGPPLRRPELLQRFVERMLRSKTNPSEPGTPAARRRAAGAQRNGGVSRWAPGDSSTIDPRRLTSQIRPG